MSKQPYFPIGCRLHDAGHWELIGKRYDGSLKSAVGCWLHVAGHWEMIGKLYDGSLKSAVGCTMQVVGS